MRKNILNKKQLEASRTLKNPLLIIAGPGTGKTKTLVERVVNILLTEESEFSSKKIEPRKIILTTFTNKAGNELKFRINERLEELGENIDISEMYLGTMHSIWIRLIQENIKFSRFFDGFSVMSGDYEQHFFIYSRLKEYKKIEGFKEIFQNLSIYENWGISGFIKKKINDLNENAIDIKELRTKDKYILFLKSAYELYEKQLLEENTLDYSSLQVEILNMLKNKDFLQKMNDEIDYIMVDEYQDSNRIQEKILLLLSKEKKNICVVGDEDQSIYRFRGATSENILNFPKHFKLKRENNLLSKENLKNEEYTKLEGEVSNINEASEVLESQCKIIILNKNYRSVEDIVKFCDRWINTIEWGNNRFKKEFYSARTEEILSTGVAHITGKTRNENVRNTVNFIKRLRQEKKITNYNQVAFLFSSFRGYEAKKLEEAFEREGIKVFSPRTKEFFESYEIKLTFGIILACFKEFLLEKIEVSEYFKNCLSLARYNAKKDKKLFDWIVSKRESIEKVDLESLNNIYYELLQFDFYRNILENSSLKNSVEFYNLSTLSKIFKSFQKYVHYKKISFENSFNILIYFFEKYINILKKYNIGNIYQDEGDYPDDCIPFLTIHQSKGLEFPVVVVCSLFNTANYNKNTENISSIDRLLELNPEISDEDKERFDFYRKFYVAFSRAKNLLVLSAPEKNLSESFKTHFYSLHGVNSLNFDINTLALDKISSKKDKGIFSFTTDINLYRICPQKYFLLRKKKFETYSKRNLSRGITIHKIIEHINKRIIEEKNNFSKGVYSPVSEKIFSDEYIENLIEKVYKFQKLELDEEYYIILEIIKNYLAKEKKNFTFMEKAEFSEYKIEEDFILYGELDLLLNKDNYLEIVDFKTGSKRAENFEIYKEQLSFYKLLLQKKYPEKEIKTFLYYLEEDEPKFEIRISEEDLERDYQKIKSTVNNILNENFEKRKFDIKICNDCEFEKFCWGKDLFCNRIDIQ